MVIIYGTQFEGEKDYAASIEPSLFSDGNPKPEQVFPAEYVRASIEPSLFSDGNTLERDAIIEIADEASIEPSLFSDGNKDKTQEAFLEALLQ